jgi:hypothetical protein
MSYLEIGASVFVSLKYIQFTKDEDTTRILTLTGVCLYMVAFPVGCLLVMVCNRDKLEEDEF